MHLCTQDSKWAKAIADGRGHFSHREATISHGIRLKHSIFVFKVSEALVDCFLLENMNYLAKLNPYVLCLVLECLYPAQGDLVLGSLKRRNVILDLKKMVAPRANKQSAFKLCVRKRPLSSITENKSSTSTMDDDESTRQQSQIPYDACECFVKPEGTIVFHDGKLARNGRRLSMAHRSYVVDKVYSEESTNDEVCVSEVLPLLEKIIPNSSGGIPKTATMIYFGQTSTGKTYTMKANLNYCCEHMMAQDSSYKGCSIRVTFYEVMGKKIFDLLNDRKVCKLLADENEVMHLRGAEFKVFQNGEKKADEMMLELIAALQLRQSEVTERNPVSSRSHAVCTLTVQFPSGGEGVLRLVDLAGSERNYETLKMTAADHAVSADINSALMSLKDCFRALSTNKNRIPGVSGSALLVKCPPRIPYRSHLLTRVLRDCFTLCDSTDDTCDHMKNNNSTTLMATVSPSPTDLFHSLNTLDHAILMNPALENQKRETCVDVPISGLFVGLKGSDRGAPKSTDKMETWTAEQVIGFLATIDSGRFSMLQLPPGLDGKGLSNLNATSLTALFAGKLRQSRMGEEGEAWVVDAGDGPQTTSTPTIHSPAFIEEGVDLGFVDVSDDDFPNSASSLNDDARNSSGSGTTAIARALWGCIKREKGAINRRRASGY